MIRAREREIVKRLSFRLCSYPFALLRELAFILAQWLFSWLILDDALPRLKPRLKPRTLPDAVPMLSPYHET